MRGLVEAVTASRVGVIGIGTDERLLGDVVLGDWDNFGGLDDGLGVVCLDGSFVVIQLTSHLFSLLPRILEFGFKLFYPVFFLPQFGGTSRVACIQLTHTR